MLLKTINKIIKKLLTRKIKNLTKKYYLLYLSQIRAQVKQGINTALKLLISIIQIV
jgi:hypothetical protein